MYVIGFGEFGFLVDVDFDECDFVLEFVSGVFKCRY